jgi:hypothetical protein
MVALRHSVTEPFDTCLPGIPEEQIPIFILFWQLIRERTELIGGRTLTGAYTLIG